MTNDNHGNLQVTGTGKVQVAPDEAIVHLGVVTDGKTATDAATSNAARTQAMISAITKQPNHGVTTVGLGVNPIMSYDPQTNVGTIVGFRATNGVEVKTKVGSDGEIFASTHGYKMPSHMEPPAEINISKAVPDTKAADKEDEKKKKDKEKKDKYKVKF